MDTEKCNWCRMNALMEEYHDKEWGVPLFDDVMHFEFISLEVLQCGLNWNMMLTKREIFRICFDGFDFEKIALYGEDDIRRIMDTDGMIRSERKIRAIIENAKVFVRIVAEHGSFGEYLWALAGNAMHIYPSHQSSLPAKNGLSERISAEMKKLGFKFMGPVTVYSYLQSCGIVNDHDEKCFRYLAVQQNMKITIEEGV